MTEHGPAWTSSTESNMVREWEAERCVPGERNSTCVRISRERELMGITLYSYISISIVSLIDLVSIIYLSKEREREEAIKNWPMQLWEAEKSQDVQLALWRPGELAYSFSLSLKD